MIVAVHQPHFLPWLGYLNRMVRADLFILLDHVQFERRNYQNRTHIKLDGRTHWLTVPVQQHSQQERIIDKRIDNAPPDARSWGANLYATLRHAYRDAAYLDRYAPELRRILESRWEYLVDLDQAMLDFLRDALCISTPLVRSSALDVAGSKSELILNLCRAVGADAYLAGLGGSRHYLDREAFARAGIEIVWQDFRHPRYAQCGGGDFVAGLSAVDLLFTQGPSGRGLLLGQPEPALPLAVGAGDFVIA
ncbi:MAG: WbqC family protein [Rhodocyclaceae bacterium]|nr:WbqC family protein [Rhodocyclaceae bacterium]